ncbi:MAG: hypothetical protein L6V86_08840 [Treponema sp.]|nr:MAG: hypothetical protein L6V86_08840 [Treponema sp.]
MVKTRFRLTRKQKTIVNCKADYVLALTDRRFGKEYVCLAKALKECRKKFSVVIWATFNNQIKEAIKDFVIQSCKDWGGEISIDKDCVNFRNGSRLYFASCNVYIASRSDILCNITSGRSPTFIIFDECGFFTEEQWRFVFNAVHENSFKSLFISSVYKNKGASIGFNTGSLEKIKLIDYRRFNHF